MNTTTIMNRIIQINLNRSKIAHSNLEELIDRKKIGIVIICEPNIRYIEQKQNDFDWTTDLDKSTSIQITTHNKTSILQKINRQNHSKVILDNDIEIISCYCSPNRTTKEFEEYLEQVAADITINNTDNTIIAGDFNAAHIAWGSRRTNQKGKILMEWMAQYNMYPLNNSSHPTFIRYNQQSFIDLTITSCTSLFNIQSWQVLDEEESMSDHLYVETIIMCDKYPTKEINTKTYRVNTKKIDYEQLEELINEGFQHMQETTYNNITEILTSTVKHIMTKAHGQNRKPKYWWTEEIAQLRKATIKKRRIYTRSKALQSTDQTSIERAWENYKTSRNQLRYTINKSKKEKWDELIEEVCQDVWGKPYKLVMNKFKKKGTKIPEDITRKAITTLFPTHKEFDRTTDKEVNSIIPKTSLTDIELVRKNLANNKAPGIDGIPSEVIKTFLKIKPEIFGQAVDQWLEQGTFPDEGKIARIVLLPKPGKTREESGAFRPICLINTLAKAFESIINLRINDISRKNRLISENQYGFRKGKSTIEAIMRIQNVIDTERSKTRYTRKLCLVVLLDVKNAFNSLSWQNLLDAMKKKKYPDYIIRIISDYLDNRWVREEHTGNHEMTAGVPQGSILGPTLWNIMYDTVLNTEHMGEGVELIAYADDLAVLVTAENQRTLEFRTNNALEIINEWMSDNHLELAPQKCEVLPLNGKKPLPGLKIQLGTHTLKIVKQARYLGVILDSRLSFTPHIDHTTNKAIKTIGHLTRLMPRCRGASEKQRRLLATVADSITMYGAPVWAPAITKLKTLKKKLIKTQRQIAIRVSQAYRTVSSSALLVIASMIPWPLLALERYKRFHRKTDKKKARQETIIQWQHDWDSITETTGKHTKEIITDIDKWINRPHGQIDYYMTQILSGHGNFNEYLWKIGKVDSPICDICDLKENDSPDHTLRICPTFNEYRTNSILNTRPTIKEIINNMIEDEKTWNYTQQIMTQKKVIREARMSQPPP